MAEQMSWSAETSPLLHFLAGKVPSTVLAMVRDTILGATARRNYVFPIANQFLSLPNLLATQRALKFIGRSEAYTACFSMGNPLMLGGPNGRGNHSPVPDWMTLDAYQHALSQMLHQSMPLKLHFHELIRQRFQEVMSQREFVSTRLELEQMIVYKDELDSDAELLWNGITAMVKSCVEPRPFPSFVDTLTGIAWQSVTISLVYWLTFCIEGEQRGAEVLGPVVELLPAAIPLGMMADEKSSIVFLTR